MIKTEVEKIKKILSDGKLDAAILRIEDNINNKYYFNEVDFKYVIIDFYQLTKRFLLEEMSYTEEHKYKVELVSSVIKCLNKYIQNKQLGEVLEVETSKILMNHIANGDLGFAFDFFLNQENTIPTSVKDKVVKLSFEYFSLKRANYAGILKHEDYTLILNNIIQKFVDLISKLSNMDFFNYYNENPLVFVVIAFHESMNSIYETIKNIGEKYNLNPIRIKDKIGDYKISDNIIDLIKKAKFVVVDLSLERPNVYFELGYARGLGKSVITICDTKTSIHFDVKDWTCLYYNDKEDLAKNLDERFRIELENG